jgi:hypothetical protein
MAKLVLGAVGPVMNAGEAVIGGMIGAGASAAGNLAVTAATPGAIGTAAAKTVQAARATVKAMLLR